VKAPAEALIYTPAKRGNTGLLILIAGPSGSGKTKSALRLATGLAMGGGIDVCDTEHGRALYYAPQAGEDAHPPDTFAFNHLQLKEPFQPARFEAAAVLSQQRKSAVFLCDSFSHEHVGPGGVLDMAEANLQRMVEASLKRNPGNEWERRDALKYTSWIEPKGEHKHLVQRLWQLNMHIIICCHAEKKLELIKNDKGKTVPREDRGLVPVCAPDIPYAMTFSVLLSAEQPGVPSWIKRFDKIEPLIDMTRPLDEATGERLAIWARGDRKPAAAAAPRTARSPRPADPPPPDPGPPADGPQADLGPHAEGPADPPPPQAGLLPPADLGLFPPDRADSKNETVLAELIRRFEAVKVRADHLAIIDNGDDQKRIAWFKRHKGRDLYPRLKAAIEASWARTAPVKEPA
jgi:hypothetical protein